MDLRSYLDSAQRGERKRLAAVLRTSPAYLSQIAAGFRAAGAELAARIEAGTEGAVRAEELRPDIDWAALRGSGGATPAKPRAKRAHSRAAV